MLILAYYFLFVTCLFKTTFSLSIPSNISTQNKIPKINLQDLQKLLRNTKNSSGFDLDILKDGGGNLGVIEIASLGLDYRNALKKLHENAPSCIGSVKSKVPGKIPLPDGSYRTTYATTTKTYLDCLDMDLLSQKFDEIDKTIIKVLNKFNEHYSNELNSNCSQLGYIVGDETISIENALEKEHIHVYTTNKDKTIQPQNKNHSDFLVPFHVDNGLFLVITPFPGHGMEVKLSTGFSVSTNQVSSDSALVLLGRGLTDWMLSQNISSKKHLFAVPHSVPTLFGTEFETRTVYARMKVPPPNSITAMSTCSDFNGPEGRFESFFHLRYCLLFQLHFMT